MDVFLRKRDVCSRDVAVLEGRRGGKMKDDD